MWPSNNDYTFWYPILSVFWLWCFLSCTCITFVYNFVCVFTFLVNKNVYIYKWNLPSVTPSYVDVQNDDSHRGPQSKTSPHAVKSTRANKINVFWTKRNEFWLMKNDNSHSFTITSIRSQPSARLVAMVVLWTMQCKAIKVTTWQVHHIALAISVKRS